MNAETPAMVGRFSVGEWTCVITVPRPQRGRVMTCSAEWLPRSPDRRLTPSEVLEYRDGRDRVLAAVSAQYGVTAAVLEV